MENILTMRIIKNNAPEVRTLIVYPHLSVISKIRAQRDDTNPLVITTSRNLFWLIDLNKTICKIDKELSTYLLHGDVNNFHEELSYSSYLRALKSFLQCPQQIVPKCSFQGEHSTKQALLFWLFGCSSFQPLLSCSGPANLQGIHSLYLLRRCSPSSRDYRPTVGWSLIF